MFDVRGLRERERDRQDQASTGWYTLACEIRPNRIGELIDDRQFLLFALFLETTRFKLFERSTDLGNMGKFTTQMLAPIRTDWWNDSTGISYQKLQILPNLLQARHSLACSQLETKVR